MNSDVKTPEAGENIPIDDTDHEIVGGRPTTIKRTLSRRHINMISLAGMIGTGLFLASGQALAVAGPVGALFGFIFMGLITAEIALASGELSGFKPVSGGFVRHATFFVQPALGAATGWNYWYMMAITGPAEISAAATLINFWEHDINAAVWYSVFIVVLVAMCFCGARVYGESEVFFSMLKILLIVGLILAGIIVDLGGSPGQDRIGFRYWKNPGPFNAHLVGGNTGKFLGFWSTMISAAYSYGNIQVVGLAGAETRNPRKVIPDAMRMTFWRVLVFYVISIFIVGLLVPYNDPNLGTATGTAQQSPFVIAFNRAGIKVLPSIINAVLVTSAFSCGAACIFLASRVLYGLAEEGQAPRFFLKTNRLGSPYLAVAASVIFLPLVYLGLGSNSSIAFSWFVNIATIAAMISWFIIAVTFLRFFYAMKAQGISRDRLPYKSPFQPYAAWTAAVALALVILFTGYSVFLNGYWNVDSFLTNYIGIPIFLVLWAAAQLVYRTGFISLQAMDLSEIEIIEREKAEATWEKPLPWYRALF